MLPVLAALTFLIGMSSCSSNRTKLVYTESAGHNWLTPRADAANSGNVVSGIDNEPYTILWKQRTGGVAACEPIVRDGLIFFCGLDRRLEIYDLNTGERRFRKRFDGPVLGVITGDSTFGILVDQVERRYFTYDLRTARKLDDFKVSAVSAPPRALNDSTILIGTWHGFLLCISKTGREIWRTECEGPIMSAPAIIDSVIYVTSGRSLFAVRANDGSKIWEHSLGGAIAGVAVVDGRAYLGAADSFATAIRTSDGEPAWKTHILGGVFAAPAIGDELVYFTDNSGMLSALDKSNGKILWTYNTGAVANHSPTICGEFLLTTSRQTTLTMLSATTGQHLWTDTTMSAQAVSSPVVVGDKILIADSRRLLICLAPASKSSIAIPLE